MRVFFSIAVLAAAFAPSKAEAVSFAAQAGSLAASVTFDAVPGTNLLLVTLTNTASSAAPDPASVLTAVFFKGLSDLTPVAAYLPTTSTVINLSDNYAQYQTLGNLPTLTEQQRTGLSSLTSTQRSYVDGGNLVNVGGEWQYRATTLPGGATQGISSSGLSGLFSSTNFANGVDLAAPYALDGLQYGVASASTAAGSGNGGVSGSALIRNSVKFVFSNYTGGDAGLTGISNVQFQYGTSPNEPRLVVNSCANLTCSQQVVVTAEPVSATLFAAGVVGLGALRRRRLPA